MKKLLKLFLVLFILLAILIGGGVWLLFQPGVQKNLALYVLRNQPGIHADIDYLNVRPQSIEAKGVYIAYNDIEYRLEETDLALPLLDLVLNREIRISDGVISGLVIDLTHMPTAADLPPGAEEEDAEPFKGVLPYTDYGVRVWGENLQATGEILFRGGKIAIELDGGGFAPGKEGVFDTRSQLTIDAVPIPYTYAFTGKLTGDQKPGGGFRSAHLNSSAELQGSQLANPLSLLNDIKLLTEGQTEIFDIRVDYANGNQLIRLDGEFDRTTQSFTGGFVLDADSEDLSTVADMSALPHFSGSGKGRFSYGWESGEGAISTEVRLDAENLETLAPELRAAGSVSGNANIDLEFSNTGMTVNTLLVAVAGSSNRSVLHAEAARSFSLDFEADDLGLSQVSGDLLRVKIDRLPVAWLSPWIPGVDLKGDTITGAMTLSQADGVPQFRTETPVAGKNLSVALQGQPYVDDLDFKVDVEAEYRKEGINLSLEHLGLSSRGDELFEGRLAVLAGNDGRVSLQGAYTANLQPLAEQPFAADWAWKPDRVLTLKQDFDFSYNAEEISIRKLNAIVSDKNGDVLLNVDTLQPLSLVMDVWGTEITDVEGDFLSIYLYNLPVDMLSSFVPDYTLSGERITGAGVLGYRDDTYTFNATKAFELRDFSLSDKAGELLKKITISILPELTYDEERLTFKWRNLQADYGRTPVISGKGDFTYNVMSDQPLESANLELAADLALLFQQPVLSSFKNVKSGKIALTANADLADRKVFNAAVSLADLEARDYPDSLVSRVDISLTGQLKDGTYTATAPMHARGTGGETDVSLGLSFKPGKPDAIVYIEAKGKSLAVDDVITVAKVFGLEQKPEAAPVQPVSLEPDVKPFWAGYSGKVTIGVQEVTVNQVGAFEKVAADFQMKPQGFTISKFEATLNGDSVEFKGGLNFTENSSKPYKLGANISIPRFDVGAFFSRANPGEQPLVTGVFSLNGDVSGQAENIPRLLEVIQGTFSLQNTSGGVFRVLAAGGSKAQGGAAALGLLGAIAGDKIREIDTLNRTMQFLRTVKYDLINVKAVRGNDLNIELTDFLLRGPEILLAGKGRIAYRDDLTVMSQPMTLQFQIGAKDEVAYLLNELRQLDNKKTADGYWVGPAFSVSGSLESPDASGLYGILGRYALSPFGGGAPRVDLGGTGESVEETTEPQVESDSGNLQEESSAETLGDIFRRAVRDRINSQ